MRKAGLLVFPALFGLTAVVVPGAAQAIARTAAQAVAPTAGQARRAVWRASTAAELEALLPARAPVEKEHIETEMRTATGITDGHGHTVAAVLLITAGYAADGKYSHYLVSQERLRLGADLALAAGTYVLGWSRTPEGLQVRVFDAATGAERGSVLARPATQPMRVESFKIWPPSEKKSIQIGRFLIPYSLEP